MKWTGYLIKHELCEGLNYRRKGNGRTIRYLSDAAFRASSDSMTSGVKINMVKINGFFLKLHRLNWIQKELCVVIANCLPEQEIEIQFRFSSLLFVCSWHKTVGRWLKSTRWRANVRGSTVCCKVFSFILSIFKWVTISEDIVRGIKSSIVSHSCFQY